MALLALNITSSISTVPPSAYTAPPLTALLDVNVELANVISPPETDNAPPFEFAAELFCKVEFVILTIEFAFV